MSPVRYNVTGFSVTDSGTKVDLVSAPDGGAVLFADVEPALRDAAMLEWLLPVLDGGGSEAEADRRTAAIAAGLTVGLTGRDLVTYAMEGCP